MNGKGVLLVGLSLVGVGSTVGCSAGCPEGYEVVMGACAPVGSTEPDAAMANDAGMEVVEDDARTFEDDTGMEMGLPDAGMSSMPDAAMAPDTGCLLPTLFADADGDGFGDPSAPLAACEASRAGYVLDATDCNDACASCYPGGTETCNGANDDCDGSVDEGVMSSFYVDADGDGFGTGAAVMACSAPAGHSAMAGDCNDGCASCRPGGTETCNGLDDDCDGSVDEGVTTTFYLDGDGDTYGRSDRTTQACTQPAGHAARGGDCDDASSAVNPGATEICDGRDNDCDGSSDEGVTITYYRDADGDSYGRADMTTQACSTPPGYAGVSGDCNDASASIRPGAPEICNDVDDDCDAMVDDGLAFATYYADCDRDGFTPASPTTTLSCLVPTSAPVVCTTGQWLAAPSSIPDCVDQNANVFPGQTTFFTSPILPTQPLGREFDYDCNGISGLQYPRSSNGMCASCDTTGATGWSGSVRACGAAGSYLTCSLVPGVGCSSTAMLRTQGCR